VFGYSGQDTLVLPTSADRVPRLRGQLVPRPVPYWPHSPQARDPEGVAAWIADAARYLVSYQRRARRGRVGEEPEFDRGLSPEPAFAGEEATLRILGRIDFGRRGWRIALGGAAAVAAGIAVSHRARRAAWLGAPRRSHRLSDWRQGMPDRHGTMIIAHRGGGGDANQSVHENTLDAFAAAIRAGVDAIELDLRRNADDELVVFHDASVRGVPFSRTTRDQVAALTGTLPPLLEEALDLIRGRAWLDLELKEAGYVERVMRVLDDRAEIAHCLVTSFLDHAIGAAKKINPDVRTGLLPGWRNPSVGVARLRRCGADYAVLHSALARPRVLARIHSAGFGCVVGGVNDDARLNRYLDDERVLGIITDRPRRALAIRGMPSWRLGKGE
jgi:glycerophosphoryl diester phosphodiesterase